RRRSLHPLDHATDARLIHGDRQTGHSASDFEGAIRIPDVEASADVDRFRIPLRVHVDHRILEAVDRPRACDEVLWTLFGCWEHGARCSWRCGQPVCEVHILLRIDDLVAYPARVPRNLIWPRWVPPPVVLRV